VTSDNDQDNEPGAGAAGAPPPANFGIGPSEPTIQPGAEPHAGPDLVPPADAGLAAVPPAQPGPGFDAGAQPAAQFAPPVGQFPPAGDFAQPAGQFAQLSDQLGVVQPAHRRRTGLIIGAAAAVAVIAVVAVVFVVTGKGGSGSPSPAQALATADRVSAHVSSATATFSEQVGTASTISGTATFQRSPLVVEEHLTETADGQSIPITGIVTPSAMYLKSSLLLKGAPKPWIKIPIAELGPGSVFSTLLHSIDNENPLSENQLFLAARHVHVVGHQVVSGVSTTKYSGSFAPLAALKYLPASARGVLRPLLSEIAGDIHFSVWVGANHLTRKFTEVYTVQTETVTTTDTFTSFNQPVTITLPPASQVAVPPASALNGSA
jgi:hypothetical protein